jgi:hypothetical protein
MTGLAEIEALAGAARPIDDDDWGTERQINAENTFFDAVAGLLPPDFEDTNLKATPPAWCHRVGTVTVGLAEGGPNCGTYTLALTDVPPRV